MHFPTLKVESMRPAGLIFCVGCKIVNMLICFWLVLHIALHAWLDFMDAKSGNKEVGTLSVNEKVASVFG
jgi:hypothetical protein